MPNINGIAQLINTALQAGNFSSRKFQSSVLYLVSDPIKTVEEKSETTCPYIIDNNGEATELTFDDTNQFQIYHKIDSQSYKLADLDYGAPGTTMNEISNMRLIFMGSRKRMKVTKDNVIAAINADFPKEFLPSVITPLQLNKCVIEMGEIMEDPYSVWSQEFQGVPYDLSTDTIMFSVAYKIDCDYNKNCFSLCP